MSPKLGPNHPDYGKRLPMGEASRAGQRRTGRPMGRPSKQLPPALLQRLFRNGGPR